MKRSARAPESRDDGLEIGLRRPGAPAWRAGWPIIASMLIAAAVQWPSLDRPLLDRHDWGSAHQAQFARNHLRYGLTETWTRCVYSKHVERFEQARRRYPDHPPLLSLLLALSMSLLGETERAIRMVPIVATVAAAGLTAWLGRRVGVPGTGLIAGIIFSLLPITVHFGHVANHEPITLAFGLGATAAYLSWIESEPERSRRRTACWLTIGMAGSILSGWAGLLFGAAILGHYIVRVGDRRTRRGLLFLIGAVVIPAALTFAHVLWSMDWRVAEMRGVFGYRSGMGAAERGFSFGAWFPRQAEWLWRNFAVGGLALSVVGIAILRRRTEAPHRPSGRNPHDLAWMLGAPGLAFVLIFRSGSFSHEYWWLHLAPLVSLLSAAALCELTRRLRLHEHARWAVVSVGIAMIGAESWIHRDYFRDPPLQFSRDFHEACNHLRKVSPPDAEIYGNINRWVTRKYFDGPVAFYHPQTEWYLDRAWVEVKTAEQMRELEGVARFYVHVDPSPNDRAMRDVLGRRFRTIQEWASLSILDLTKPAALLR